MHLLAIIFATGFLQKKYNAKKKEKKIKLKLLASKCMNIFGGLYFRINLSVVFSMK